MRIAPDVPYNVFGFVSQIFFRVIRQAGVPFTSSNFSDRKTRRCFDKPVSATVRSGSRASQRVSLDAFTPVSANGITPRGEFTLVFKHALARCEWSHRKHALTVN